MPSQPSTSTAQPSEVTSWRNVAPGDLRISLDPLSASPIEPVVQAAAAAKEWAGLSLEERASVLKSAQKRVEMEAEDLAAGIALETGKPLKEARGELAAVVAKFDLAIEDAGEHLADRPAPGGPHPSLVRHRPRGIAAVIGPFNFPIHLAHGAAVAHLLAGNPVIFKPSPLAGVVAARYARLMAGALPSGVFGLVQGGASTGATLCKDPRIRSICFTGSVTAGRSLAVVLAGDFSKDLALELGGKNAVIVCDDADLDHAAQCVVEGMCLTTGQRCNSTSRVLVAENVAKRFIERLLQAAKDWTPGWPLDPSTRLGPLVSAVAMQRYQQCLEHRDVDWLLKGSQLDTVQGRPGHYVTPAIAWVPSDTRASHPLLSQESFAPLLTLQTFSTLAEAVERNNQTEFGLTCSIFTRDESTFWSLADAVTDGNVYANLPTTFSPGTLPFGGWGNSGNRKPGGRGFIRFTTEEQAVQCAKDRFGQ